MSGEELKNLESAKDTNTLKALWDKLQRRMLSLFKVYENEEDNPDKSRRRFLMGVSAVAAAPVTAPVATKAALGSVSIKVPVLQKVARLAENNASYNYNLLRFIKALAKNPESMQDVTQMLKVISSGKIKKVQDLESFLSDKRLSSARELINSSHFLSGLSIDDLKDEELMEAIRFLNPELADSLVSDVKTVIGFMEQNGFTSLDEVASSIRSEVLKSIDALFKKAGKDSNFARANKELLEQAKEFLNSNFGLYFEHAAYDKHSFLELYHGLEDLIKTLNGTVNLNEFKSGEAKSVYNEILNVLYSNSYTAAKDFARRNLGKQIVLRAEGAPDAYSFESKKELEFGKVFNELLHKSPYKCVKVEVAKRVSL